MVSATGEGPKRLKLTELYETRFPPLRDVADRFRSMLPDPKLRLAAGADCAFEDPAIVIEFIRSGCLMGFSEGKPPVTTLKLAIERLGAESGVETLEAMKKFPPIRDGKTLKWFNHYRILGRWAGVVAEILAEPLAPGLVEDCRVAGCMLFVGDMLAVIGFGETYTALREQMARPRVVYQLEKEFNFNTEDVAQVYLKKLGIPELLLFSFREGAKAPLPVRGPMKPVIAAARELILAHESNRWERYEPGAKIAPKSAVRMLGLPEQQYSKLYGRMTEYLSAESKKRAEGKW